jgi:hypothetical protein
LIIEKLIVSSDISPRFINFWPIVASSWKKIFGLSPTLALVTNRPLSDGLRDHLLFFGEVEILSAVADIPIENQAKLARWFTACKYSNQIVSIEDIDTIFLSPKYLVEKLSYFEHDKLLGIGSDLMGYLQDKEVLKKFPASNLTGKSDLFSDLFGYKAGMSFENFLNQFNGIYEFDKLEDPYNSHENFSDESLIRALRKRNDFTKIKLIPRDLDIKTKWLDRSWWPKEPPVSVLDYVCVNFPRPLFENRGKCEFLLNLYFPEGYPWVKKEKVKLFSKIMWEYKRKDWKILFKLKAIQGRLVSKFKN